MKIRECGSSSRSMSFNQYAPLLCIHVFFESPLSLYTATMSTHRESSLALQPSAIAKSPNNPFSEARALSLVVGSLLDGSPLGGPYAIA